MDLYYYFIFLCGFVSLFHVFKWIWLRIIGPGSPGSVGELRAGLGASGGGLGAHSGTPESQPYLAVRVKEGSFLQRSIAVGQFWVPKMSILNT